MLNALLEPKKPSPEIIAESQIETFSVFFIYYSRVTNNTKQAQLQQRRHRELKGMVNKTPDFINYY